MQIESSNYYKIDQKTRNRIRHLRPDRNYDKVEKRYKFQHEISKRRHRKH